MELVASSWGDYAYLDSGDGYRLERFGPHVLKRPAPSAVWRPGRPDLWNSAAATFERDSRGGGEWSFHRKLPESWTMGWRDLRFVLRPTGSGQVGLFPEQQPNWDWIGERVSAAGRPVRLLNLFSYTGSVSVAAAKAGAEVCHVDAVKSVVRWASENARSSGLGEDDVRWIVDDAVKFLRREGRRGNQYDAVVLDPPSFGRGSQGQVFKFERDIAELLDLCWEVLSPAPCLLLFTCHTPGITTRSMENLLLGRGGNVEGMDIVLRDDEAPAPLPAGVCARWTP